MSTAGPNRRSAIRVMDPYLASKIAAGEVIERPASVVRELVENALDAGARRIEVEILDGGVERIVISDDGHGIPADEIDLAFRRHATSKLHSEADLNHIATLGFRGEALPSVAAVSNVVCTTRATAEPVGTVLRIEEGAIEKRPTARQPGTTLVVERLFAHFPARRKFLRTRASEAAACVQVVTPLALAFPEVQFRVQVDGRVALETPGDAHLRSAAVAIFGAESEPHLLDIPETSLDLDHQSDEQENPVVVAGLCATGSYHRSGRSGLHVLVNRRPVQNRALAYAVVESYGSLLPVGRQPVAILNVRVPPAEVDFNVHPSKLEVKLLRERAVYATIQRAIRAALAQGDWSVATWNATPSQPAEDTALQPGLPPSHGPSTATTDDHGILEGGERLEDLRVLGQAGRTYVIAEGDAGVYLVDQHAAHERVLLEELRASLSSHPERQLLLEPLVVDVPPEAATIVDQAQDALAALGFEIDAFGPRQVAVRAVPAVLANRRPGRVLAEALLALATNTHGLQVEPTASWTERLALVLACKTAVRAGDDLSPAEMHALLRRLGEAALCRTCAHGRPTAILLSHAQLERQFGRR